MKARRKFIARRSDLIGMRGRHDRSGNGIGSLMLDLVEPDLRPLCDNLQIAGMREIAHIEHARDVLSHPSAASFARFITIPFPLISAQAGSRILRVSGGDERNNGWRGQPFDNAPVPPAR